MMDKKYILIAIIIIIIVLLIFLLWNRSNSNGLSGQEYFTTQQTDLANKILIFFKSPNTYPTYVKLLVSNNNTSTNLATLTTYSALAAKGNQLQLSDILTKF